VETPGDASDAELAAAAQRGQPAAWAALVRRYQRLVFSIARRHRLNPDDAGAVFDSVFAERWHPVPAEDAVFWQVERIGHTAQTLPPQLRQALASVAHKA